MQVYLPSSVHYLEFELNLSLFMTGEDPSAVSVYSVFSGYSLSLGYR